MRTWKYLKRFCCHTVIWGLLSLPAAAEIGVRQADSIGCGGRPALLPQPQRLEWGKGHFALSQRSFFSSNLTGTDRTDLANYMAHADLSLVLQDTPASIRFDLVDKSAMGPEAYRLRVTTDGILAEAAEPAGLFYAFQTLQQLAGAAMQVEYADTFILPCVTVTDEPRYAWRGLHLDVSRHFFDKEFVMKQIDAMARYKMNRFHWHLTDGPGWRLEIKRYPQLTQQTAYRPFPDWKSWWNNGRTYCEATDSGATGGYYTQDDVRQVIEYARQRHIEVIPEIEMPAHSEEVLYALPQLACGGGHKPGSELCVGKEQTFTFLTGVLSEVMDLFPSAYIHIGGDEADVSHWAKCPDCLACMKREGLQRPAQLQGYLIRRIEKFLKAHGRYLLGWDEVIGDSLSPEASAVMVWRGEDKASAALQRGMQVVLTPGSHCYFDSYQDAPFTQPEAIGGYLPLQKVYAYDPAVSLSSHSGIMGVQANLWTEYVTTPAHAEYMLYPRLLALAEVGWTQPESKCWTRFRRNALAEVGRLKNRGYNPFDLSREYGPRPEAEVVEHHLARGAKVVYVRPFSSYYPAGADSALTDGLQGGWTYTDQRWQGFSGQGLDVIVDLGKEQDFSQISVSFMQLTAPGVWLPRSVKFLKSADGHQFHLLKQEETTIPVTEEKLTIHRYGFQGNDRARYIRVTTEPNGIRGAWMFADEIIVK